MSKLIYFTRDFQGSIYVRITNRGHIMSRKGMSCHAQVFAGADYAAVLLSRLEALAQSERPLTAILGLGKWRAHCMIINKNISLGTASFAALAIAQFVSSAAYAQTSDRTTANSGTNDIVVTATKRDEALEKVPVAVSVVTEAAINEQGITRASDFLDSTPNVTFIEDNAGEAYINIRGQTSVRNSDP